MPIKLLSTACDSSSDIIAMHGIDKDKFTGFRNYRIDYSAVDAFKNDRSGALVGSKIASRYDWKVGQQVVLNELNGISINISGIFDSSNSAQENVILAGRQFLQEAVGKQGISNQIIVKIKPGYDQFEVSDIIDKMPLSAETTTKPEQAFLSESLDQLMDLVKIGRLVIGIVIAVVLVAIGNAISMATRERYPEFGIMRTLGFGRNTIMAMVIAEGVVQTLMGGMAGGLAAYLLINSGIIKTVSSCGVSISMSVDAMTWILCLAAMVLAGSAGSIIPAWTSSRIQVASVIRKRG